MTSIYEQLIAEITDEDERKVFDTLLQAHGQRVTRAALVKTVYGAELVDAELADSTKDRKVRVIINRLRERDYPIVSSSDAAGYTMQASEEEMEAFISEQGSRLKKIQANIDHAYRSKRYLGLVRQWREENNQPVQLSFAVPMESLR